MEPVLDDFNTGIFTNAESCCGSVTEREIINCPSPGVPAELNQQFSTKRNKPELLSQGEKAASWCSDQFVGTQKRKHVKCPKRPDWNINKPLKRYIPASEKYPKQLQKQREEKKVRRQMELLHLVERNSPGPPSQNRGTSPAALDSSQRETEPRVRRHPVRTVRLFLEMFLKTRIDVSRLQTVLPHIHAYMF